MDSSHQFKLSEIRELQIVGKNIIVPKHFAEETREITYLSIRNNSLTSIDGMSMCQ